jgi:hypothetical protein
MNTKFFGLAFIMVVALLGATMLSASVRDFQTDLSIGNVFGRGTEQTEDFSRHIVQRRTDGPNLIEAIYQDHDDNNWWVDEEKIEFEYDDQDRPIESVISYWDEDAEEWVYETRHTYQWDGDNLIDIMVEMYDQQWQEYLHIEQEFNDQNQIILSEAWANAMGNWIEFAYYEYDYDANNRVESMTQTFYMEPPETNRQPDYERTNFYYDANDRIDETIHQISVDGATWTNHERSVIDFHANDNSDYQLFQDMVNNNIMHMMTWWLLSDEPMADVETYYEWATEEWHPFEKDEFDYFENNEYEFMTKYEYYNDDWHILFRDMFLYDENWLLTEVIYEWYDNGQWDEWGRTLFYYDPVSADEITVQVAELSTENYPNPFNPETTIAFNLPESGNVRVDIYNMRGQKVKTILNKELEAGEHQVQWNGKDRQGNVAPSGIYFYRVDAEGGRYTSTRKMLLLK